MTDTDGRRLRAHATQHLTQLQPKIASYLVGLVWMVFIAFVGMSLQRYYYSIVMNQTPTMTEVKVGGFTALVMYFYSHTVHRLDLPTKTQDYLNRCLKDS